MLVPVFIDALVYHKGMNSYLIALKEIGGKRSFPVFVNPYESQSITRIVDDPDTNEWCIYDNLYTVITDRDEKPFRGVIAGYKEAILECGLHIQRLTMETYVITMTPGSLLAMAVRFRIPIFINEDLFEHPSPTSRHVAPRVEKETRISLLKRELNTAVKGEQYEQAARLRDEIEKLLNS